MIPLPSSIREWSGEPIQVMTGSARAAYSIAWTFNHEGVVARILRGSKMTTRQGVFDEFGAALQFGDYFGENWDALNECVNDLDWLEAPAYLLVIVHAERILSEGTDREARILFDILGDAARAWLNPDSYPGFDGRTPRPFNVLLQATRDVAQQVETLRARSEAQLPLIDLGDFPHWLLDPR